MKLFRTTSPAVVECCQLAFNFLPVHSQLNICTANFVQKFTASEKRFIGYAEDVEGVFEKYQLHHHLFADDMQGLSSGPPSSIPVIASTLYQAVSPTLAPGVQPISAFNWTPVRLRSCGLVPPLVSASFRLAADAYTPVSRLWSLFQSFEI